MTNDDDKIINWTRPMLEGFKKALRAADKDVFVFDGHEFFKGYAKYLIEFLEDRLPTDARGAARIGYVNARPK